MKTLMNKHKLSADPMSLILSIIAIVIIIPGFCCGYFIFVPLILGIIALATSNKSLSVYQKNPDYYLLESRNNMYKAKIISIIVIIISSIILLLNIVFRIFFNGFYPSTFFEQTKIFKEKTEASEYIWETEEYDIYEEDTIYYTDSIQ